MNWGSAADWVSAVGNAAMGIAACFAVHQGIKSLTAWRRETIGRRRIELAEDVLADFYEARDIISWVRSPIAYSHESEERAGREDEPEEQRRHRDTFYVPLNRLKENAEFFGRMQARRYRVLATFGPEAAEPYEAIREITTQIAISARNLMRFDLGRMDERARARWDRYEADIWEGAAGEDKIAARISETLAAVDERFRKEITTATK